MPKMVLILGCTAVGKGSAARELARLVASAGVPMPQIVSVDSMKVYRRMDIGTAKPPPAVRAEIVHHCIDVVEPWESFSVAQYVQHADRAIASAQAAGATAICVGGTSLYIKALVEGLFEGDGAGGDGQIRADLEARIAAGGLEAMHADLSRIDPAAAARIHRNDRRRIIRALEVYRATGRPISELQRQWDAGARRHDCVLVGLRRNKDDLAGRINLRARRMVDQGLAQEVADLLAQPRGLSPQAAQAVGYAEMIEHVRGHILLQDALEKIKVNTRRLAKKQRTWHRRFRDVRWLDLAPDETAAQTAQRIKEAVGAA